MLPIKKTDKSKQLAIERRYEAEVTTVAANSINEQMTRRKTGPPKVSLNASAASNYANKMALHY